MLKKILSVLAQTYGLQAINNCLAEICDDRIDPYQNDRVNKFYDELSEAYDNVNKDYFQLYDFKK